MRKLLISLLIVGYLSWFSPALAQVPAERGSLSGIVISVSDGSFVVNAKVTISPGEMTVGTNLDGIFEIELPPGKYDIRVNQEGFLEYQVSGVTVKAGESTYQDIAIAPQGLDLGSVTVTADVIKASAEALLIERKSLPTLSDAIGSQEMSKLVGGGASDVMERVTGVTVVDSKYVFVRGLGERYSSTMLNGSVIPSTQPDKKVVAMDMLPASLLENVRTDKSYTPDQPGEFSGGTVRAETKDLPSEATMKISVSQGFGTNTTFDDFLTYPGGSDWDWLGFGKGARRLPAQVPNERIFASSRFTEGGYDAEELQAIGQSFSNVWTPSASRSALPNTGLNFSAGNTFGNLGMVLAYSYSNKFHNQQEERKFYQVGYQENLEEYHNYDFDYSTYSVRQGLTANFAYQLGDFNRLLFRNFYTRDSSDEARFFEGFDGEVYTRVSNQRLRYVEEGIYSGQLGGEHYIGALNDSFFEWKLTYSRSSLDEPNMREASYEERSGTSMVLANEPQSTFIMNSGLTETMWEPAIDWNTFFNLDWVSMSVKIGASYRNREREFSSRRFRFSHGPNINDLDLSQSVETLLSPENINPNQFEVEETTRSSDAYGADQITRAGYGMLDASMGDWRFIGGLRLESNSQLVDTYDPFDPGNADTFTSARLNDTDLLGSFAAVYRMNDSMNLRGSFARTVNRPQFREMSPFEFTDISGGLAVVGNPDLRRAVILNYDLRWEWYLEDDELFSFSFFHKDFDSPIERFLEPTATLRLSYLNAEKARNSGFEVDLRKNIGSIGSTFFTTNVNFTFVDSNVTIPQESLNVLTTYDRPLAGQSKYVVNGILEWQLPEVRSLARVLFNYHSSRIVDVGALGLPDVHEEGYPKLDAIFMKDLSPAWSLKISGRNLLDQPHEYTQGGLLYRKYSTGQEISVGISYDFFAEN